MLKNFATLRAAMSPERQAASAARAAQLIKKMPLQGLRHARELSQESLAKTLGTNQSSISKLEKRSDMYISTLRGYIEGMGGQLEIRACFPAGDILVTTFGELDESGKTRPKKSRQTRRKLATFMAPLFCGCSKRSRLSWAIQPWNSSSPRWPGVKRTSRTARRVATWTTSGSHSEVAAR